MKRFAVALAAFPLLAMTAPANATEVEETPPPPMETYTVAEAEVELIHEQTGEVLDRKVFDATTMDREISPLNANGKPGFVGDLVPSGDGPSASYYEDGFGGSSSPSGCQRVTVTNTSYSMLGFVVYRFNIWTYWCWNRAQERVYNVDTGWYISNVDPNFYWKGLITKFTTLKYFAWKSGASRSGYIHARQGRFENCVLKYGCIGVEYPTNRLRSRSNGTFYWAVEGADR